jgi:hypothetical protein
MSQQYEESNHGPSPSASYDRVYEAIPQSNMGHHEEQKISSQNPTIGQRLALAIASLSLLFIMSFTLLLFSMSDYTVYVNYPVKVLSLVIITLCFFGTVAINIIFNRRR